jgi:acyl carrier protein
MLNDQLCSPAEAGELVLGLFREALGSEALPADADFFENGGDSVKAVAVIHKLRDLTGIRIPLSTMFLRRTAEEFTEEVISALGA